MKRPFSAAFLLFLVGGVLHGGPIDLLKNEWKGVLEDASQSGKHIYIAFIGEGWSMASNRFDGRVLQSEAFKEFAQDRLLLCHAEARRKPKLNKQETAHLQAIVVHFDIKAWPTFIVCGPDGQELLRHGYLETPAEEYVAALEALTSTSGPNP